MLVATSLLTCKQINFARVDPQVFDGPSRVGYRTSPSFGGTWRLLTNAVAAVCWPLLQDLESTMRKLAVLAATFWASI